MRVENSPLKNGGVATLTRPTESVKTETKDVKSASSLPTNESGGKGKIPTDRPTYQGAAGDDFSKLHDAIHTFLYPTHNQN